MASRIGNFRKMLQNLKDSLFYLKRKDRLVGSDQFGNKYFERDGDKAHNLRAARYIEERKDLNVFDVPEVPVEWSAWLRGRRKDPPTSEEIQQNHFNMIKTQMRAAELERKFSDSKTPSLKSQPEQNIAVDIESNKKNSPFPVHEDFEVVPGQKSRREQEK